MLSSEDGGSHLVVEVVDRRATKCTHKKIFLPKILVEGFVENIFFLFFFYKAQPFSVSWFSNRENYLAQLSELFVP